jgi:hypothetical protein
MMEAQSVGTVDSRRMVTINIQGPDHMAVIIRDHEGGRITNWSVMPSLSPSRPDGTRLVQIDFGSCEDGLSTTSDLLLKERAISTICRYSFTMEVNGPTALEISAYGHYMHIETAGIKMLRDKLPDWARGGEWANFPSALVSLFV